MTDYKKMIEDEAAAYIAHHWSRLDSVLRVEYFDPETKTYGNMRDEETGELIKEPSRLNVLQLWNMSRYCKRIEMLGTASYMVYFSMYPDDKARIRLIGGIYEKLIRGEVPCDGELTLLSESHERYMEKWKVEDPSRYYNDDPTHVLGIG